MTAAGLIPATEAELAEYRSAARDARAAERTAALRAQRAREEHALAEAEHAKAKFAVTDTEFALSMATQGWIPLIGGTWLSPDYAKDHPEGLGSCIRKEVLP